MTRRFKGFLPNYDYKELNHTDLQIIGLGDTAICCYRAKRTYRYRDAEELTSNHGRNFMILKKIDGSWKIAVAHWTFD
jgi:ketosteroid isomerase-like protein